MNRVVHSAKSSKTLMKSQSEHAVMLQRLEAVRILCFTWNVGNAEPSEEELQNWLPEGGSDLDDFVDEETSPVAKESAATDDDDDCVVEPSPPKKKAGKRLVKNGGR